MHDSGVDVPIRSTSEPRGLWIAAIVVNAVAGLVFLYVHLGVIPKFKAMFKSLGGELPRITQVVVGWSEFLAANVIVVVPIVMALGFLGFRQVRRGPIVAQVVLLMLGIVLLLSATIVPIVAIWYPILELQKQIRK